MIVRRLLDRIEDSRTGEIIPKVFQTKISEEIHKQNVGVAESWATVFLRPIRGTGRPNRSQKTPARRCLTAAGARN